MRFPLHSGYDVVRILAAVVFLVAAGLKCHQLATEPVIAKTWLDNRWLLMVTVEFELFFGLWLLSNNLPRLTWLAALGCFSLFTCISLYKAMAGYGSCGCFGSICVPPAATTTLDLAFVLSLLIWRPHYLPSPANGRGVGGEGGQNNAPSSKAQSLIETWATSEGGQHSVSFSELLRRALVVLLAWLPLGLPAAYAMGSYKATTLSDAGVIVGDGKLVVLEPETWIGKRFPLLEYIDIGEQLKNGKWLVLLYHHDCPKCQAVIRELSKIIRESDVDRVALVAMPPYVEREDTTSDQPGLIRGRLKPVNDWFAETPVMTILREAEVVSIDARK